jgi:hypothetical protein
MVRLPHKTRKQLEKLCDKAWSARILAIWSGKIGSRKCAVPGCSNLGNNPHHIFSRKNKGTRWDLKNGIILCAYHHSLGIPSAHNCPVDDPLWFRRVLLLYYTEGELDYLSYKAKGYGKLSLGELEILEKELRKNEVFAVGSGENSRGQSEGGICNKNLPF